jgi:CDP-glycerol glycerophosphotransferase
MSAREVSTRLARVVLSVALNLVYAFASLIPRSKKLWLFSAWDGKKFIDNPKYIYKWILQNNLDLDVRWVAKDNELLETMRLNGFPAVYAYGPRGIWAQLRAGAVIFTHNACSEFVSCLLASRVRRVQAWHGIPIKKIGFDDSKNGVLRLKQKIYSWLAPHTTERLDIVIAASETDKLRYESAFKLDAEHVKITGYPRNDEIVRSVNRNLRARSLRAIYMPTFRGSPGSEFTLLAESGFDFTRADESLNQSDVDLYIKLHPVQRFSRNDAEAISCARRIHGIGNVGDIYEDMGSFDILITDFSGIYFDFLITGRPIIMAPFNIQSYIANDRELYYRYEEICPESPCSTWDEVFDRIRAICRCRSAPPSERYRMLQQRFHQYLDAGSSERVVHEIIKLMNLHQATLSRPA